MPSISDYPHSRHVRARFSSLKGFNILDLLLLGGALIPAPFSNANSLVFVPNLLIRLSRNSEILRTRPVDFDLFSILADHSRDEPRSRKFLRILHTPISLSAAKRLQANELTDILDRPYAPPQLLADSTSENSVLDQPARFNEYKYWCAHLETNRHRTQF
jgi:hypothetical protein